MSNSEPDSALPSVSAKGAEPAPAKLPDLSSLPKLPTKLPTTPKLPKQLEQVVAEIEKPAKPGAAATAAPAASESAAHETLWTRLEPIAGWAVPATLVPLAIGVGVWWWKKKQQQKEKKPAPAPEKSKPSVDMYADWKSFRRRLPRSMRRALDDLQPVIVLGNTASEKEMLALQLSRVADNEQLFPGRVSYRGKGLDLYLGARSLVLVPSDEFLDAPASSEDGGWRKVLLKVARVRAPRVVVCLAQAPLDTGNLDEVTLWTSKLRAHVDVIVAVRNEDIELSVALVQAPGSSKNSLPRSTDALFELLGSLAKHEGLEETLSLRLDAVADQLSPRVEERRESAKRWVMERLRRSRKGWPRLLAHPEYDSARVLMLARFFEEFDSWSASLGAGLAELLVHDERQARRVLGQELCFVPCVDRRLIGSVAAFAGPSESRSGRWRPKQSLVHRLVVATVVGMLAVAEWLAYEHDKTAWDEAATAALRYDPPEGANELDVVRRYVEPGTTVGTPLAKFFERDGVKCVAVDTARRYVSGLLDHAVDAFDAPEDVLQLVGLFIAGNALECPLERGANRTVYAELSATIEEHIEQWRHVTGLSEEEIAGYLELACPQTRVRLSKLEAEYAGHRSGEEEWDEVPSVATFAQHLQLLRGACQLTAEERAAIEYAEKTVSELNGIGERHGAALSVLETLRKLDAPSLGMLIGVFDRYEPRLQAIEDLGDEHDDVQLLARDLRPFSDFDSARTAAPEVGSLAELNAQLRAHLAGEVPEGEDAMIRLTVAANTYVIDRQKMRASLMVRALGHLQQDFVDTTIKRELAAGSQELVFFPDSLHDRMHHWTTPGSVPNGVAVLSEVPWRYTAAGFRDAVLGPIESMHELFGGHRCGDGTEDPERDVHLARANEFVETRLGNYLRAYADAWRRVYDCFTISANDDGGLAATLAVLSRPTSIQVALLREVMRQTRLSAADGWPFVDMLGIASAPFDTLEGVVNDKALADYQGFILELANAGQDSSEPSASSWAPAAPAPQPTNADDNVKAFIAGLSGFGRVVVGGLRDPKTDVRTRAQAWAKAVGLAPASSPPLMRPIEAAYERGDQSFARGLVHFWVGKSRELRNDITDRFPFNQNSSVDADVEVLTAWLDPLEGRFGSEVLSIYRLAMACGAEPCVELPPGMQSSVERLIAIQQALFDEKGEPQTLKFQIDPVPFASQPLLPKLSVLKLGEARYEYFNTAPRTLNVVAPWNEAYVATLSVELAGAQASDELAAPIGTRKSPWAFQRLLASARSSIDGRYGWELDATLHGIRHGTVSVSYDVCRDIGRCNGLLERVLDWQ